MSGSGQSALDEFTDSAEPDSLFGDVRDYIGNLYGKIRNRVRRLAGIDMDWWAKTPTEIDTDEDIWVYQFVVSYTDSEIRSEYDFDGEAGARARQKTSPSPELQFKTGIYVIGEPTTELENHIKSIQNPRLQTCYNTGVYSGYIDGFGFSESAVDVQRERVSAREVEQKGYGLGVPWFEVEAYDEDGELEGYSDGYHNPFTTETTTEETTTGEEIPQNEVWHVGGRQYHDSGERYQISPEGNTGARDRAKAASGKTAVINGFAVGSILSGGRIRLKVEYTNPDRATYASRKQILEGSGTPYQALSEGARIYKVGETDDRVIFSTSEPEQFDAPEPDDISPDAVGVETTSEQVTEILLDDSEPTQYYIETDRQEGRLLGLYNPPVTRSISTGYSLV